MIGQTLDGRYVIRSRIARGGMAMVYLANDLRLERRVAVKVMHEHLADDENFTRRFDQEARSAARLGHPNVVNVFDQGHDAGRPYLVMEYLPGITLRELLKQQTRLTEEQALEVGEAVLAGLAAAHHAKIVHRDLKPENVLLADDGRIKIGDFGLARAVSANTTTGQALLGTIAYLSPELVTRGVADARSDIYAFGIMMFEMLTGSQPFTGEQPMQIAYQHAHSEVPPPSSLSAESTPELDELVRWTTQREPDARPRDAGIVLDHLRAIRRGGSAPGATQVLPATSVLATPSTAVLDGAQQAALAGGPAAPAPAKSDPEPPETPPTPIDRASSVARRRRRRGRIAALCVLLLTALAGGAGWWFGQGPGSRVLVPSVAGAEMASAQDTLTELSLVPEVFECSSVDVPAGSAVRTEPDAGTRVDRGTVVRLCQSTGPEMLPVPLLVGLPEQDAQRAIEDAGFTMGEIAEERFDGGAAGTVIAALGQDGEALAELYPERAVVDLILSAGSIPDVSGSTVEAATAALSESRLTVDPALNTEAHSDTVPEGQVIGAVFATDPVTPGDSVGLQISLGPELFEVPDVSGKKMREAVQILRDAGFTPVTGVPELLWNAVRVEGTSPAAGERLPRGANVDLNFEL
ncbi:Stk1 family PASTA domain-containing Ser/Thr kinase [Leucobacter sp. CSA1]|uniref:non-specific serine/threonine protein kinase n=1 Tax=Leucobacter chromiisoli TaxID=2796471 RepID=A0A934Q8T8_9MICO|nr:Stk1 family PASTA domain-containing Ser/Thr kinase [Leucobacter chromiisoli]